MARITPRPPPTRARALNCLNQRCPACGGPLWFAYENDRTVTTLEAVIAVTLQVRRCVNPACAFYHRPYRPELEGRLALPHHEFGLDVIAWIGACRYQAHGTVPEIHHALTGRGVVIAPRTVDHLLGRYEELVSVVLATPVQRARLRRQGRLIWRWMGCNRTRATKCSGSCGRGSRGRSCWPAACGRPVAAI